MYLSNLFTSISWLFSSFLLLLFMLVCFFPLPSSCVFFLPARFCSFNFYARQESASFIFKSRSKMHPILSYNDINKKTTTYSLHRACLLEWRCFVPRMLLSRHEGSRRGSRRTVLARQSLVFLTDLVVLTSLRC